MKTLTRLLGLLLIAALFVSVPMQDSYAKWTHEIASEDGQGQLGWGPTNDGDPEEPSLGHSSGQTRASQEANLDAGDEVDEDRASVVRVIWLLVKLGMLRIVAF